MKNIKIQAGDDLDQALKSNREPGTEFRLSPGVHRTRGAFGFPEFDFCMLAPECTLAGAEPNKTVISVEKPLLYVGLNFTGYLECFTGGARTKGESTHITMRDLTLDLTQVHLPTVGLHIWSSRPTLENIRVKEVKGYRNWPTKPNEGFGILVNNSFYEREVGGGARVEGCYTEHPTLEDNGTQFENYSTGIYVGYVRGAAPLLTSKVEGCSTSGLDYHCGFAFNDHTDLLNCETHGARRAIFGDTGHVRCSTVKRLKAYDVGWALEFQDSVLGNRRHAIVIEESRFQFRHIDGWAQGILVVAENTHSTTEGVHVTCCTFIKPEVDGSLSKGRSRGAGARAIISSDNLWIGPWKTAECQTGAQPWVSPDSNATIS